MSVVGTLHFSYVTLGSKCLWLIRELEKGLKVDLNILDMKNGEHKSPEYMKLNPHGTSPTLVLPSGRPLWESGAIIYHILETYDTEGKLWGKPGSDIRTTFHLYQALAGEAESTMIPYFMQNRIVPEDKRDPALCAAKKLHWEQKVVQFYDMLITSPDQKFAVGNEFSAVDIAATYSLHLAKLSGLLETKPTLKAYADSMAKRPHFQDAFQGAFE